MYVITDAVEGETYTRPNFDDAVEALLDNLRQHLSDRIRDEVHDANDVDMLVGIHLRHEPDDPDAPTILRVTYDARYLQLRLKPDDVFLSITWR